MDRGGHHWERITVVICKVCLGVYVQVGGLEKMEQLNTAKANKLYSLMDKSGGFYHAVVEPAFRSRMNVPFRMKGYVKTSLPLPPPAYQPLHLTLTPPLGAPHANTIAQHFLR